MIWVSRDMRVPWVAEFNAFARESREADRAPGDGRRRREVAFPPGTPMSGVEERLVEFSVPMTKDQSREAIYGMPFEQWKATYQKEASKEQQAAFEKAKSQH